MRTVRLHEEASLEAIEAAAWYESERPGLGFEFERAVDTALDLLEGDLVPLTPMASVGSARGVKRLTLRRFPYDVVVQARNEEIFVIAFAHHARRPGYWRKRMQLKSW